MYSEPETDYSAGTLMSRVVGTMESILHHEETRLEVVCIFRRAIHTCTAHLTGVNDTKRPWGKTVLSKVFLCSHNNLACLFVIISISIHTIWVLGILYKCKQEFQAK